MRLEVARSDAAGTAAAAPPPTADTDTLQLLKDNFGTDFTIDPRLRRSIMSGQCVAFIGAGFSKGVTNMDWSILIQKLVEHVGEEAKRLPSEVDCSAAAAGDIREKKEKAKYIMHEFQKLQKGTPLQPISCTIFQHHVTQPCRQRHISHTTTNRPRS
jgi:hypothetical protein